MLEFPHSRNRWQSMDHKQSPDMSGCLYKSVGQHILARVHTHPLSGLGPVWSDQMSIFRAKQDIWHSRRRAVMENQKILSNVNGSAAYANFNFRFDNHIAINDMQNRQRIDPMEIPSSNMAKLCRILVGMFGTSISPFYCIFSPNLAGVEPFSGTNNNAVCRFLNQPFGLYLLVAPMESLRSTTNQNPEDMLSHRVNWKQYNIWDWVIFRCSFGWKPFEWRFGYIEGNERNFPLVNIESMSIKS